MSERRGWPARLGLVLLAFFFPGSAHLRLARPKRAAALFGTFIAIIVGLTAYYWLVYDWTFEKWLVAVALALTLVVVVVVSAIMAWRDSAVRLRPVSPTSRWYAVLALPIFTVGLNFMLPDLRDAAKTVWIPGESMRPTLEVGDRMLVQRRHLDPLQHGQVIVFDGPDSVRVDRLIAVGGQRIELRGGRVIINGVAARLRATSDRRIWRESLPGEAGSHLIRNDGVAYADDFGPIVVPPQHLFLLGDNRNMSADSRFAAIEMGIGMVPTTAVIGRARFIWWSRTHGQTGREL